MFIRTKSHRAREKFTRLLGNRQQWFSFHFDGAFYDITPDEWIKVKQARIKGITKAQVDESRLQRCWQ